MPAACAACSPRRAPELLEQQVNAILLGPAEAGGDGASPAADVWAFGCLLLHMLSGSPPWHGLSVLQVCRKVGGQSAPLPALCWPPACTWCRDVPGAPLD
jgi:serine/threonine protein kinase